MGKLIHYYKTYKWALEVGFTEEEAKRIAGANLRVDSPKPGGKYERGRHLNTNLLWMFRGIPTQLWYANYHLGEALRNGSLEELGKALHSLQDWIGHSDWPIYGYHWKGPWRITLFGRERALLKYDPDMDLADQRLERLESHTKKYLVEYLNYRA